jgi:tetratricopeptide (TPR) repeat protein
MDGTQYKAFISYSHSDSRWASWLHKSLEAYRPPKQLIGKVTDRGPIPKRLAPVFRDREELASATDLGSLLTDALSRSACLIVICSPRAARSRWVNEEILAFKRLGREDRVFCLIVDGEPNASDIPGQADQECFPQALRFRLGPDGNLSETRTEPIAADAREGKDGKNRSKLKLIAGLLGVGFDALRQRETQRRNRQLLYIAAASFAGMVLATSLAAAAFIARAQAQREKVRAEAEAETARQTTNFLVDLFRISDPSEARGNSVTAREMLDKGATRIQTELAGQPVIQATLFDTVGTVYMGLGLYDQAKPLLNAAVTQRRELRDPNPVKLSESLNHLGDVLTLQAAYDDAARNYEEALALQRAQPQNPQARALLAKGQFGLGVVFYQQGRYPEAERLLRDALATQKTLLGETHGDIARTLQNLSKVAEAAGNLEAAIPLMQSALDMQRKVRGKLPHPDVAEELNDLGYMRQQNGEYAAAEALFLESLAMKRVLLGEKHPEIAMGLNNLAYLFQDKGDLKRAEATYREALSMQRELLGNVHPDVANTLNNLAFVQDDKGDLAGALVTERECLAIYRTLFPGDHPEVARITNRIGYWLVEAHQYAEAGEALTEALAMRRRLFGENHPDVASSLTHLAILQVETHQYREALESAVAATEVSTKAFSATHWRTAVAQSVQGAARAGLGEYPEAERLLTGGYQILSSDLGALPTYRNRARDYLEDLYQRWRRPMPAAQVALLAASAVKAEQN